MDVSVCVISQPIAGMPTLIYNIAHQYSLYKPALLNHMLLYWQSIVSRACTYGDDTELYWNKSTGLVLGWFSK
jgi:hypothetical protein